MSVAPLDPGDLHEVAVDVEFAANVFWVFRVYVLEELLDEVDVREDHAAAAVAAELEEVDGFAREVAVSMSVGGRWKEGRTRRSCRRRSSRGTSPRGRRRPVSMSAIDAPSGETKARTLPQEKQRMGMIMVGAEGLVCSVRQCDREVCAGARKKRRMQQGRRLVAMPVKEIRGRGPAPRRQRRAGTHSPKNIANFWRLACTTSVATLFYTCTIFVFDGRVEKCEYCRRQCISIAEAEARGRRLAEEEGKDGQGQAGREWRGHTCKGQERCGRRTVDSEIYRINFGSEEQIHAAESAKQWDPRC